MRIQMTGSEWFGNRPGGLNRYFDGLVSGLAEIDDSELVAHAFGDAPVGGRSWGATGQALSKRIRASRSRSNHVSPPPDVLDRHFALYGASRNYATSALRVFHFHGPWASESEAAGEVSLTVRAKRQLEKQIYRGMDHFIVLSTVFRDVLVDDYGILPERITIIPPGVKVEDFTYQSDSSDPPRVLCVRRLEKRMGIHVLLDAWPLVRAAVPRAELRIVGTGTSEGELRAQAAALEGVTFLGRLSDVELREEYARATVTTVPTVALEGFGLIALESLASGRAPILTNCGGLPDSVRGFDESLIVPVDDAHALGRRLARALEGQRPSAKECRAHAEKFSWDEVARNHVDLYRRLGAGS